ncbi:MAG TPA: hypothetical protein VG711_12140, partial [Phycisphaerales bacterium]|nr:hypothetical protein [Phycisphaerales bacterium]
LIALPFRKPDHERVELAVDANGTLHLLTREMNLRDLRIVEVWARKHRELIMLACPQITLNVAAEMVSHLFADDPSDLMDLHGTGIQLHILARANVGLEDDGVGTERQVGGWYHGQLTKCSQPTRRPAANSSEHADCLIH